MRIQRILPAALLMLAACGTPDSPTSPLDQADALLAKSGKIKLDAQQKKACKPVKLDPVQVGEITEEDCYFELNGASRFEDLYSLKPAQLLEQSGQVIAGSPKIRLSADADFNGVLGLQADDKAVFEGLVHRFRRYLASTPTGFSVIGGEQEYKVFVGGDLSTDLGAYTLTTTLTPGGGYFCGESLVLAGSAAFDSEITDTNSCAGTIQFGPYAGNPLRYQYRFARFEAGREYTITVDGISASSPEVALFVAFFPTGGGVIDDTLDLGEGVGDADRSITLTASASGYYYIEVSTIPGRPSTYHFTYTTN